jgi:hypothetical protein
MVRPVFPIERMHFRAYCSDCREIGEVCAKKLEDLEAVTFAVSVLRKAGWHVDGLAFPHASRGVRWLCPKCAKAERR